MYSQNKEEEVILNYFGFIPGTLCSIGENDGVTFSNVKALIERGWKGILIEPSPKAYAKLKELYKEIKGVYTYQVAIGNHNGEAVLFESMSHLNRGDVGLLSTLVTDEMHRWRGEVFNPIDVKIFRWKTFLNRVKYKTFDFISIDAEGLDLDILKQIDLTETKMVCVEWNGKNKQAFIDSCPGFRIIHENGENLIFAR